jgi:hypothetical protein
MIAFYPSEVILLTTFHGYELHLTTEDQHLAARSWFDAMGIAYEDIESELAASTASYLRWSVRYLAFTDREAAVAVRLRWT